MRKYKIDIEIKDSDKISGGYLYTTEMLTEKQAILVMAKLGKELLRNEKDIDRVSYTAWEADTEDYENCACVCVIVSRWGRGFHVTSY